MPGMKRILAAALLCVSMAMPASAQSLSAEFGNGRIIIESGPGRHYDRRHYDRRYYEWRHHERRYDARRDYRPRHQQRDPHALFMMQRHERNNGYRRHDDRRGHW